ncbi:MAG: SIR2 family protein [Bifidobacteriaceae bacterium]|jgi:hypothetical protein|nr:SIR2 family protein [Bifidobacteriaceae bacterium]
MRFADVDIPIELVQAQAEGQVVFFVGADVSMPAPANLPSFADLTRAIARLGSRPAPTDPELEEPDVYLGRLEQDGVAVHDFVAQEIGKAKKGNNLHDALATLATHPGPVRLVTSNHDDFLSAALTAQGAKPAVFEAPALPLGDGFEGVVHLHGRLGQESKKLVVTDGDFGKAYITRHWASDFLREMFAGFTVCFVGYSHNDHLMRYFARGLSSEAKPRYILTEEMEAAGLRKLGLTPITYPDGQHDLVAEVLARWAGHAASSPLTRARRIRSMAGDAPPADPDDADFLTDSLEYPLLVTEVCDIAKGGKWFAWLSAQDAVARAVEAELGNATRPDRVLAEWFASTATRSDELTDLALAFLAGRLLPPGSTCPRQCVSRSGRVRPGTGVCSVLARKCNPSLGVT